MLSKAPPHDIQGVGLALDLAGGGVATVRALDAAGMEVETDVPLALGQLLDFELRQPGSRVKFAASGVIVGVRRRGTRFDVRIRFDALRLRDA
ncbi:MAG: PilZ domain-containing protein [Comamonadaceae bacterium]|nr:MAG: PilZ domain-containing protein [Comamonadaceae bacterium]